MGGVHPLKGGVAECLHERTLCDDISRREMSSSLIYTWRKQLRAGNLADVVTSLPVFAELQVVDSGAPPPQPAPCPQGFIHVELPGGVRVNVDAAVGCRRADTGAVRAAMSQTRVFLACRVAPWRSTTTSQSVRCAVSRWGVPTGCSPVLV